MHLEDELVQRLLHGELAQATAGTVRAHVDGCAECRARLARAEREEAQVLDLLRRLDHAVPAVDPEALAVGAHRAARWARWAAGILLALAAAGVGYAAPQSPLHDWVNRAVRWVAGSAPAPDAGPSGIAVEPGQRFTIVLDAPQAGGRATVALTDGFQVVVRTADGPVRFTTGGESLLVAAVDSVAEYEVELPRSAPWVEIRAGDRRLLLKQGARIVTDAAMDPEGRYVLELGEQLREPVMKP